MIKKLRVTVDGKPFEVTVEMEDEAPKVVAASPAPAAPTPAVATAAPTPAPVSAPMASASASNATATGAIVSPLSGRVIAIGVAVGQDVKEGEHVLTLEAMKMNTFVFAQKGGKVREIAVAVGDAVHENQPLILLD